MMMRAFHTYAVSLALLGIACGWVEQVAGQASPDHTSSRRTGASRQAGEGPALQLARMAWLECSGLAHPHCFNDAAAIWSTSREALGVDASDSRRVDHLKSYTKLYMRGHARAIEIAGWPDGDIPGKSPRFNRVWRLWREHAAAIIAGKVTNPCPGARHWGGPGVDDVPPSMVPVRCTRPTRNLFLRMR